MDPVFRIKQAIHDQSVVRTEVRGIENHVCAYVLPWKKEDDKLDHRAMLDFA